MRIIKPGKTARRVIGIKMTCPNCDCEFVYGKEDVISYTGVSWNHVIMVDCPNCKYSVIDSRNRDFVFDIAQYVTGDEYIFEGDEI